MQRRKLLSKSVGKCFVANGTQLETATNQLKTVGIYLQEAGNEQ